MFATRAAAFVIALGIAGLAYAGGGKLPFGKDHDAGMARAKKEGKPAIIYFTADW